KKRCCSGVDSGVGAIRASQRIDLTLRSDEWTRMRFEDKIVLVTGASKGIGAACACRFALEGATVVVNYHVDQDAADAVVAQIRAQGGRASAIRGSVAVPEDVDRILSVVDTSFGRLDALINNAGVFKPGLIDGISPDDFRWHFETNVLGTLLMCQMA